jgi:hypothetical protein
MELEQPFSLPTLFWTISAAAEDEHRRVGALKLRKLAMFSRMI